MDRSGVVEEINWSFGGIGVKENARGWQENNARVKYIFRRYIDIHLA